MTTFVAVLYSIVLPRGRLVMKDLVELAETLGLEEPRTFLATGNLMFESRRRDVAALEHDLETAFAARFDKHVDIIVRTAEQWHALAAGNPFPAESAVNGSGVGVRVQRAPLRDEVLADLEPLRVAGEHVAIVDGDLWFVFPDPGAGSRLLSAMTVKRLGIGTNRAWNTVRRLDELVRRA